VHPLLYQRAVNQQLRDFLAFASDAFIGELLARDDLAVDDDDRVGGIHRYLGRTKRRGLNVIEANRLLGCFGRARLGGARCRRGQFVFFLSVVLPDRLAGPADHGGGQGELEEREPGSPILCEYHVASPQFLW
jgi:hypothetical protein